MVVGVWTIVAVLILGFGALLVGLAEVAREINRVRNTVGEVEESLESLSSTLHKPLKDIGVWAEEEAHTIRKSKEY